MPEKDLEVYHKKLNTAVELLDNNNKFAVEIFLECFNIALDNEDFFHAVESLFYLKESIKKFDLNINLENEIKKIPSNIYNLFNDRIL